MICDLHGCTKSVDWDGQISGTTTNTDDSYDDDVKEYPKVLCSFPEDAQEAIYCLN